MESRDLASYIDHTILKPNLTLTEVMQVAKEVSLHGFASVCIPSSYIKAVKTEFPNIKICTVVSFPFGYDDSKAKLKMCESAINDGADELDLVTNVSWVKSGLWKEIEAEMLQINNFIHSNGKLVKWIFENSFLSQDEIIRLCELCNITNADFAKTSTGFGSHGARMEDVLLMKTHLNSKLKIKASGGIKTLEQTQEYINAGVSRIGTSSGMKIISN